jgi:hypothetical protein
MPANVTHLPAPEIPSAPAWDLAQVTAELARITRRLDAQEWEMDRAFAAGVALGEARRTRSPLPAGRRDRHGLRLVASAES